MFQRGPGEFSTDGQMDSLQFQPRRNAADLRYYSSALGLVTTHNIEQTTKNRAPHRLMGSPRLLPEHQHAAVGKPHNTLGHGTNKQMG